jgi:hypothetical protein
VVGEHDLLPVQGATITLSAVRRSVTSTHDGTFQISDVPVGEHTLELDGEDVLAESLRQVPVSAGDSTCVLFLSRPVRPVSPGTDVITERAREPLIIVNGVARIPLPGTTPPAPLPPGNVMQIRNPFIRVPMANLEMDLIGPDSATRLYGQLGAFGAVHFTATPHAPCSTAPLPS